MFKPSLATLLYATVFLTGAAVLIFEVAAVRLLAPYFGSSLSVLSSVLSVILLALSLGYYIGGRLADRYPATTLLFGIIGTAGLMMILLLFVLMAILPATATIFGLGTGPLIASLFGFFIPALLLGIDSPFVSKLLTKDNAGSEGATVGTVFFLSTIGSITGSLLAGFVLIPYLGIITTISSISILLIFWTFILSLTGGRTQKLLCLYLGICLVVSIIAMQLLTHSLTTEKDITILHEVDGLYSHLIVYEKQLNGTTYRFLKNDTNHSSAINPATEDIVFSYAQYATLYRKMVPDPARYLVLGGGAFTVPRHIHADNPSATIDAVEIEPYLKEIATTYFGLPESDRLHTYTMDARLFLQSTTTTYDVIFSDIMNSGHFIPPHVLTKEFFTILRSRLADSGVVMLNYIGSLDTYGTTLTGSLIRTIATVFPNYKVIAIGDPASKNVQNLLIILRPEGLPIEFEPVTITQYFTGKSFDANDHFATIATSSLADENIFTDNRSQSELLMSKQLQLHSN
jgi:predicted membrane-bound spermidine synthase